ncbi:MAG: hypothetical protein GX937_14380 [Lentisphaerae bacterium]|nr:hypothetical protein [Lentisphaerota bacterium]
MLLAASLDLNDRTPAGIGANIPLHQGAIGLQVNGRASQTTTLLLLSVNPDADDFLALIIDNHPPKLPKHSLAAVDIADNIADDRNIMAIDQNPLNIGVFQRCSLTAAQQLIVLNNSVGQMRSAAICYLAGFAKHHPASAKIPDSISPHNHAAWHRAIHHDCLIAIFNSAVLHPDFAQFRQIKTDCFFFAVKIAVQDFNSANSLFPFILTISVHSIKAVKGHIPHNQDWEVAVIVCMIQIKEAGSVFRQVSTRATWRRAANHTSFPYALQNQAATLMSDQS